MLGPCKRLFKKYPHAFIGIGGVTVMMSSHTIYGPVLSLVTCDFNQTRLDLALLSLMAQVWLRFTEWIWELVGFAMLIAALIPSNRPCDTATTVENTGNGPPKP